MQTVANIKNVKERMAVKHIEPNIFKENQYIQKIIKDIAKYIDKEGNLSKNKPSIIEKQEFFCTPHLF